MTGSSVGIRADKRGAGGLDGLRVVDSASELSNILAVLTDDGCRAILQAAAEPRSAEELSEVCNLPRSSTYRKLNRLTEAGLLEERTRVCRSKRHVSEYVRLVENVIISFDGDDVVVLVTRERPCCDPARRSDP